MKRAALALLSLLMLAAPAMAQGVMKTQPLGASSAVSSGTIAVTNTFQAAIASDVTRKGCRIQNLGANTMYVYVGAITSATTASSFQLATKGTFDCAFGGVVATDAINITGTAADGYVAVRQ